MEIKYIFKMFIKWLWLIVLVPAIAGAGAYYVSVYKTVPVYEAKATMYILNSLSEARITAAYGDITSAQNAIKNYGEIIKSKSAINEALDGLNLTEYSAGRFLGNISVVFSEKNSFVVGINVKDVDPKLASDMANILSEIFVDKTDMLMKMSIIKILDKAEIPAYPTNDETKKNVSVATMAGIIFCVVIIFMVEYAGTVIIKDGKDVQKYLDLPVLATIPNAKYIKTLK